METFEIVLVECDPQCHFDDGKHGDLRGAGAFRQSGRNRSQYGSRFAGARGNADRKLAL
jgi:hypothetical protein